MKWTAPGKLFLFGEYAVLRGAPAIVTAVDRRVVVRATGDDEYRVVGTEADPALPEAVSEVTGKSHRGFEVDVRALADGSDKLGLGSSAASTVALTAAVLDEDDPQTVFEYAYRAHRAFQGEKGSGGDVAAATFGKTLFIHPADHSDVPPTVQAVQWPRDLVVYPVWTGAVADTRVFVDAVEKSNAKLARLSQLARTAVTAFTNGDTERLVVIASDYDDAMGRLGSIANIPIRTRLHNRIARIVRDFRATAKPSGAGGGDVSLIFARGDIDREGLRKALPDPARLLDIKLHQPGLRREE